MSAVLQATFMNHRSFGRQFGDAYEGGFYAGQISTAGNGIATHNLVLAPKSSGESAAKQWKTSNTSTAGTGSVIDGATNSSNMNNASHPAAQFCEGLSIGGFSDWYMPALNEFEVCYYNLKPTAASNYTSSGINANAVPARSSNYTSGNPAQTSAGAFQSGNAEAFNINNFWVSTEASATEGWAISISDGRQFGAGLGYFLKVYQPSVRAIRKVAV